MKKEQMKVHPMILLIKLLDAKNQQLPEDWLTKFDLLTEPQKEKLFHQIIKRLQRLQELEKKIVDKKLKWSIRS